MIPDDLDACPVTALTDDPIQNDPFQVIPFRGDPFEGKRVPGMW